ncbi:unnamed protein product [Lepeophtheirus salmonis]|uniref:(salmon louse) hypothetical protein n=1 Tax=Lepeophtheirus salmonis TaxID=72036 RepID=A0A7R8CN67_LEPSM|nr:unnamed protein product [Lepeophtheirus salmonis]CAF2872796.1 unnamed protein product [Lepeophtheirus salmonis]
MSLMDEEQDITNLNKDGNLETKNHKEPHQGPRNHEKEDYIKIINENLKESAEKLQFCQYWTYQQDNDPKYNAKVMKKWFKDNNINIIEWLSKCSGLNAIQNLWPYLTRVTSMKPINLTQLEAFAKEEFANIPLDTCRKLVESYKNRLEEEWSKELDVTNTVRNPSFKNQSFSNTLNLSRIDGLLKVYPNRRCVLLSLEPSDISLLELQELFSNLSSICHFYFIDGTERVIEIYKLGRLLSPVAERAILVNGVHLKQEIRNLRGITLRMVTLPWYPFIQMDCPLNLSLPCKCTGLAMDISNSLSDMMNFTLECYKEKSLTWGTLPLEDGKENGLMGSVINEIYDLGPPVFYQNELRMNYVDFLKCTPSASAGFYYLKNSSDPFLLFRPFTIVSWMSILGVIIPILGIVILLQYYDNNYHQSKSYRLLIFSISFLFVIVNAYYGGALTMFFYNGGQCSFQFITRCGERPELGNNLYDRIRILSKYVVKNISTGLQRAKTTSVVFIHNILSVGSFLGESNYRKDIYGGYHLLEKKNYEYSYIFKKNSPLSYFFSPGLLALNSKGIVDKEIMDETKSFQMSPESSFLVLNLHQMSSVFCLLCIGIGLTFVVLLIELAIIYIRKRKPVIKK